jgi:transcriptional regulator GlxA family with amidase domain
LRRARGSEGGASIWAEVGILQWAAQRLCQGGHGENGVTHGIERDPVAQVLTCLRSMLDQALDLESLGKMVGVSPHHLSRMVKAKTGMTLQWHLRKMRIEHACELLASGRSNVTETAYSCGYQSLSHFAKAFREETGVNPKMWLQQRGLD